MSSARANHWNIVLNPTSVPIGSSHSYSQSGSRSGGGATSGHSHSHSHGHGGVKKKGSSGTGGGRSVPAPKPFKCHLCSRCFERNGHLQTHISAVHEQKQPYKCDYPGCGLSFGHRSSLSRHRKGIHKMYD